MPALISPVAIADLLTLLAHQVLDYNLSVSSPFSEVSYRAAFYAVGLCRTGTITLKTDLDYYHVAPVHWSC